MIVSKSKIDIPQPSGDAGLSRCVDCGVLICFCGGLIALLVSELDARFFVLCLLSLCIYSEVAPHFRREQRQTHAILLLSGRALYDWQQSAHFETLPQSRTTLLFVYWRYGDVKRSIINERWLWRWQLSGADFSALCRYLLRIQRGY